MGLLCERATFDNGYLELETEADLKSRVRENCTHGSVRGSGQAFHATINERSVETAYSTDFYGKT